MKKKLFAVLILAAIIVGGASAQLVVGVQGVVPSENTDFSFDTLATQFQEGTGVAYGAFAEIAFKTLGFAGAVNVQNIYDSVLDSTTMVIDIKYYLTYHLFGIRSFVDPFLEFGAGLYGTENLNTLSAAPFAAASYYWFGGAGVGVNLGPLGVFAKFAYNNPISAPVQYQDSYGYTQSLSSFKDIYSYFPTYMVTVGVKLTL